MRIRVAHSTSQCDKPGYALVAYMSDLFGTKFQFKIITLTGVGEKRRSHIRCIPGVGSFHPEGRGPNQSAVLWDANEFELIKGYTRRLSTRDYEQAGLSRVYAWATVVILRRIEDNDLYCVMVAKMPSAIPGNIIKRMRNKALVYNACMTGWRRIINEVRDDWPNIDHFLVGADWGMNLRLPWVRSYLRHQFASVYLRPAWTVERVMDSRSSFGRSLPDGMFHSGITRTFLVFDSRGTSDHDAVGGTVQFIRRIK